MVHSTLEATIVSPTVEAFLRGLGSDAIAPAAEAILVRRVREAREALAGITVDDEELARTLGERLRADADTAADVAQALAELGITDVALALACARGDRAALVRFESVTFPSARPALGRIGLSDAEMDEVFQILREKLFVAEPGGTPRVVHATGRGDLAGLVRTMAVRTALNLRREDRRVVSDDSLVELIAPDDDPELALLKHDARAELKRAFQDAVAALEARERNVLRLHVLHGLTIDEIGRTYQVHRATAARWLERLRDTLDRDTRRRLRERLGLDRGELESLMRIAQSRVTMSFRRLLA
jgi:RNA polymerase sigma-70 factor (ECF subfamily)